MYIKRKSSTEIWGNLTRVGGGITEENIGRIKQHVSNT